MVSNTLSLEAILVDLIGLIIIVLFVGIFVSLASMSDPNNDARTDTETNLNQLL